MSNTGTYKYIEGQGVVKVSDRIPNLKPVADWKRRMDPMVEQQRVVNSLSTNQIGKERASI